MSRYLGNNESRGGVRNQTLYVDLKILNKTSAIDFI